MFSALTYFIIVMELKCVLRVAWRGSSCGWGGWEASVETGWGFMVPLELGLERGWSFQDRTGHSSSWEEQDEERRENT